MPDSVSGSRRMSVIEFRVKRTLAGWVVESASTYGPFVAKDQAVDLARGMVSAVRATGNEARLIVEGETAAPSQE
jgi:hypothetical protein